MRKSVKKVMFIAPPVTRPSDFSSKVSRVSAFFPLGIAYIAAYLEKNGKYDINILDALMEGFTKEGVSINNGSELRYGLSDKEIAEHIRRVSPDVVGVSCLFAAIEKDTINVCRIVKEIDPDITTVVGGAHAGANAVKLIEQNPSIDFVIQGEAEVTFRELVSKIENGNAFSELDGIAYRENNTTRLIPKTRYIEDLDSLPFPARHMFDMNKYFEKASAHSSFVLSPYTQVITSRGCPFKCTFCALGNHWGSKQRMRGAKNVLDEIEFLVNTYHIKELQFEDDNLTADKKRALEIFGGIIERKLDIIWVVPSGMAVASLDEELLVKMKASHCYSVTLAIESGSQWVLSKLIRKPVNLKKVPDLVKTVRRVGLEVKGFFIIGYPDETKETVRETIQYAKKLELDWAIFSLASPIPNTEMYKTCVEKGYFKEKDFDPVRSFYSSFINTPEFTSKELMEIREEAIIDINFRNNPNLIKYDVNKAIENFKQVLRYYPHFDFANFYLGEAYLKKGEKEKALESYEKTLLLNPSYKSAQERINELTRR
ncbi:MAG: cobalamin-dependent protein [Elusimicrobia bacterium]|nr:cobalamin-dependent protein [Elusimicrobiota bacterium]